MSPAFIIISIPEKMAQQMQRGSRIQILSKSKYPRHEKMQMSLRDMITHFHPNRGIFGYNFNAVRFFTLSQK